MSSWVFMRGLVSGGWRGLILGRGGRGGGDFGFVWWIGGVMEREQGDRGL